MAEPRLPASVKLTIHDLSRGGSGVGRLGEQIVFVPFTAPGDEVEVEITRREKRYLEGRVLQVLKASEKRVPQRCPVFSECGGCSWQHLPYELQWETKRSGVLHALKRTLGETPTVPLEEFPAENPWNYRNRIQLRAENGEIGFFRKGSRSLVGIERCDVARPELNEALRTSVRALPELAAKTEMQKIELDVSAEGSVRTAINQRHAAFGFRQVNDAQNAKLREWVSATFTKPAHLLDLYGGAGNLSLPISERMLSVDCVDVTVPGPEAAPSESFRFHRSEVLPWLKKRVRDAEKGYLKWPFPRVAVLDPPREGLYEVSNGILESFDTLEISRFALVGCDPDSFARDVARILKAPYRLESLAVFDFFPQTPHVESAARFVRAN